MAEAWAFVYGSLVSETSAAETLGRDVELRPATLDGWRRGWWQCRDNATAEKRFERIDGQEIAWCVALDISRAAGAQTNGAVIAVSADELERLDRRELRYDRVEVGAAISTAVGEPLDAPVHAWTAKPANRCPDPPEGAIVIESYLEAVEAAFASLGRDELECFRTNTAPPACEVAAARLLAGEADIPAGNPRAW